MLKTTTQKTHFQIHHPMCNAPNAWNHERRNRVFLYKYTVYRLRMAVTHSLTCRPHRRSLSVCSEAKFRNAHTEIGLYWTEVLPWLSSSLTDGGVSSCSPWPLSMMLLSMSSEQRVLASSPTANRRCYSFAAINHLIGRHISTAAWFLLLLQQFRELMLGRWEGPANVSIDVHLLRLISYFHVLLCD